MKGRSTKCSLVLLFIIGCWNFTVKAQAVGDYGSNGSATLSASYSWLVCTSAGTWAGATTTTSQPSSSKNVWILNNDALIMSASINCNNFYLTSGASLVSSTAMGSTIYVNIFGTTVQLDGTFGDDTHNLSIQPRTAGSTVTITSTNNSLNAAKVAILKPNANDISIIIDRDITLTYAGASGGGGVSMYASGFDGIFFTLNAGKTLTTVNLATIGIGSSQTAAAGVPAIASTINPNKVTFNFNGNVNIGNGGSGGNLNMNCAAGNTTALNVGGTLNIAGRLLADVVPAGIYPITVTSGGRINFNGSSAGTMNAANATTVVDANGIIDFSNTSSSTRTFGSASVSGKLIFSDNTYPTGITLNSGSTVEYKGAYTLSATAPVSYQNLIINSSGTITCLASTSIIVNGDLTLSSGTFADNGNTITLAGNIAGTATHSGAGKISMTGTGKTISGVAGLSNLEINSAGTITASAAFTVNGNLSLVSGTFSDDGYTISLAGNITGTATHSSSGAGKIRLTASSRTITAVTLGNFELASGSSVSLIAATIKGILSMSGGNLTIGAGNTLTMFNGSGIIRTSGNLNLSSGTIVFGSTGTDNISVTIAGNLLSTNELPSSTIGKIILTINNGITYTLSGSKTNSVRTLALNGVLSDGGNGYTLNVYATITGTGTVSSGTVTVSGNTAVANISGATFSNLTLNDADGFSLTGSPVVNGTLTLTAGALSIGSNTLTLNGAVVNTSGTLSGTSASNLTLGGTAGTLNFTAASHNLNNLTLNTGSSAILGTALDVYGTITLATASLNLNAQNLTLKSNASGTARIADLTGSTLTGASNVTMERWIPQRGGSPTGGRAYRLLAPTVNTTGSVKANWMEGVNNTAIGTNNDPNAGYGTQISGSGGSANGFDVTASNAPSLYFSSNGAIASLTYTAAGSTTTGTGIATMNALTGYFLYIRGDRSVSMQVPLGTNMPTTSTTLRTTGTLVTGPVSAFTNAYTGGGAHNLVTNPYPSPISWASVKTASSNITPYYTLWDPNVGSRGGFVTVHTDGTVSDGTATINIQPGQAFFVESDGGIPAVNIQEGHKTAGNNNTVFIVPPESFQAALYFTEDSGYRRIADGVNVRYDNVYSTSVDINDARELENWDENIAISRESKRLAIETRPVIMNRDTIPLFMNNMKARAYEFEFVPASFTHIGLKAELIDRFLNTRTLLSVVDTSRVNFTVTADPASKATDRFMVIFGPMSPLAIDVLTIKAQAKNNGVQVDWTAKTEKDMDRYELERSFNGTVFTKINTTTAIGNSPVAVNYSWLDANPQPGYAQHPADNFYRIKAIDKAGLVKYTDIVKVNVGKLQPAITVSPNPVSGNSFVLRFTDLEKGNYNIAIINSLGQRVYSAPVQYGGGSANITVTAGALAKGIYEVVLTGDNIRITNRLIKN